LFLFYSAVEKLATLADKLRVQMLVYL